MLLKYIKPLVFVLLSLTAFGALAHTGHEDAPGFVAGFMHPLTGADHLMAMLAVGIWSAMTTRRIWVAPLSFASLLLIGALLGLAGLHFPAVEPMIAASLLVLGLLLVSQARLPLMAGALLTGAFALFHGAAHGAELGSNSPLAAIAGMVLGTALIHIAGLLLGRLLLARHVLWARVAGGCITIFGAVLLTGVL
ncbi:MAG: HupE/UreJ family protein [Zoogloeaceae bacterium]|jgi:urease accessory protein|nr:HupE/UreJ family protein [Zoogloeaceae bacterium]